MKFQKETEDEEALFPPPMPAHDDEEEEIDEVEEIEIHPSPVMSQEEEPDYEEDDDDDDDDDDEEDREEEVDSEEDDNGDGHDNDEEEVEVEVEVEEEEVPSTDVPTTAPLYLVYQHGRRKCRQSFFSISEGIHFIKSVPEMNGMTCCASCEGWLVMLDKYGSSRRCFLFNPISMEKIELPTMKAASNYLYCVLSASPPDCVIMFLYQIASCVFCRPNDQRWTRIILKPRDKEGKINYFALICGAVSYEGKIYISFMDGDGIKVLTPITTSATRRINNRSFTVDKIKIKENPPEDFLDVFNTEARMAFYLIESCGEVFMVVKSYWQFGLDIRDLDVYSFTVFKLKYCPSSSRTTASASWEKVESLGADRVFFLAQPCSVSASASKLQVKENCIYYSEPDDEHLYAFDMEKQNFYSILPCPHLVGRHTDEPSWMLLPTV